MNTWFGIGTLTRDPEIRYTPSGLSVSSFGIAINEKIKGADQKLVERADFFECTIFGKSAENFCEYMAKGRKVAIQGKLRLDQWEDKTTKEKRSKVFIIVDNWTMCDSKPQGQQQKKAEGYTPSMSDDQPF